MALLKVHGLTVHYGSVHAVRGIDLSVDQGEIVTLLGPNGAGKSSTLNAIVGLVATTAGSVHYAGEEITRQPTEHVVAQGLTLAPEGRRVFATLTVAENLLLGAYGVTERAVQNERFERIYTLFPILYERLAQYAGTLSGGEQQMLALARALMSNPRLLLLDEPSLGLAPMIVETLFELIATLREQGVTLLLVEQNVAMSLAIADRGYVLGNGAIVAAGSAAELQQSSAIGHAFLGEQV